MKAHWQPNLVSPIDAPKKPAAPTDGRTLIGYLGGKLLPVDLPVGAIVVSPAGLVARVSRHWTETTLGKKSTIRRKRCELVELGRWQYGVFQPSETEYTWPIYSDYKHRGGDLGGWAAWGVA